MGASDIHISQGRPILVRVDGKLLKAPLSPQPEKDEAGQIILNMLDGEQRGNWNRGGTDHRQDY